MCGIAGLYSPEVPFDRQRLRDRLQRVSATLAERGPDGEGIFLGDRLGFVHRRLAIIDRTERSAQPMTDAESGSALTFNGEIYNFLELRTELEREGSTFRSDGDAEVLLAGLCRHGIGFLSRVDGDFAFAFWNAPERELLLARDRFGVKPLYLARTRSSELAFSSGIRGLFAAGVEQRLRREALREYLSYRYVSGEETMFAGVRSLPPGHFLRLRAGEERLERYWNLVPARVASREEGLERLGAALETSISRRLRADVGLGLLLSGGVDSSALALELHRLGAGKVHAVTYEVPGALSEAGAAAALASRLGFEHHVIRPPARPLEHLRSVVRALEQPLGDSIILPASELFAECRKHMTVVLSGEGADEIFGGYAHQRILKHWTWLQAHGMGGAMRASERLLGAVPLPALRALIPYPAKLNADARARASLLLRSRSLPEAHRLSRMLMSDEEVSGFLDEPVSPALTEPGTGSEDFGWVLGKDLSTWLPDYGLLRTDRLSMSRGLECRVPYLSHPVAEAALGLTLSEPWLARDKKGLRDWAARRFPGHRRWPAKQPFFLPAQTAWGGAFAEACDDYLSPERVRKTGILSPVAVSKLRSRPLDFLTGKKLTSLVILQSWLEEFFESGSTAQPAAELPPSSEEGVRWPCL